MCLSTLRVCFPSHVLPPSRMMAKRDQVTSSLWLAHLCSPQDYSNTPSTGEGGQVDRVGLARQQGLPATGRMLLGEPPCFQSWFGRTHLQPYIRVTRTITLGLGHTAPLHPHCPSSACGHSCIHLDAPRAKALSAFGSHLIYVCMLS